MHAGCRPDRHAIDAHRALVHASGLRAELRDVEGAAGHAVAAADALVLLEIDDAVGVLHDGTGRGTGFRGTQARRSACTGPCASASAARRPRLVFVNLIRFQKFARRCRAASDRCHLHRGSGGRSFHSWQATSQALQPMHVVVSMSLADGDRRVRGDDPRRPVHSYCRRASLERLEASVGHGALTLCLLQLHEEALVLRRERVRIDDRRRHQVGERAHAARRAQESPVDRERRSDKPSSRRPVIGLIRRVTMRSPSIEPRAEVTRTRSPFAIPFSRASSSGISTKNSGCSCML